MTHSKNGPSIRYWRVSEFGRVLAPRLGNRLIAVLYVYLDASKTEESEGITSVAGYVGSCDEWQRVEKEWVEALAYWNLPKFHLSELGRRIGHERKRTCVEYFANIIRASNLAAIGCAALDRGWPAEMKLTGIARENPKYAWCLRSTLLRLIDAVNSKYPGEYVSVVCDKDANPNLILEIFQSVQKDHAQLANIQVSTNKGDARIIPLECADLIAGWFRRQWLPSADGDWTQSRIREAYRTLPTGKAGNWMEFIGRMDNQSLETATSKFFSRPLWKISYTPEGCPTVTFWKAG